MQTAALINLLFPFAFKTYSIRYYRSGIRVPPFATLSCDILAVSYCGVLIQSDAQTCQNTVSASAVPISAPSAEDTSASCLMYGCLISCGGLKGRCFGCWHPLYLLHRLTIPPAPTISGEHSSMSHTLVTSFFVGFLLPFQADIFLLCSPSVFFTDGHVPSSHHIFNFLSNNFHGFSTSISISHVIQFNKCLGYESLHQAQHLTGFSKFTTNIF